MRLSSPRNLRFRGGLRSAGLAVALSLLAGAACSGPAWTRLDGRVMSGQLPCPAMPASRCALVPTARPSPVAGVLVTAISTPDKQRFIARTGSDGRFSLSLPGGDFDLYAASVRQARVAMVGYPAERRYIELTLPYSVPLAAPHG